MTESQIIMYGTRWCGDCRRSKKVLEAGNIPYRWVDIDTDPAAAELVRKLNRGNRSVPTILFPNGDILVEPSNAALAAKIGATP